MPDPDVYFTPYVIDDTYLNMELKITRGEDGPDFAKVTKQLGDKDGLPIDRYRNNSILYTIMYKVEYKDRHKALLVAIAIIDNMLAHVDGEENQHVLFQDIVDHRYDSTEVKEQYAFITTHTGMNYCRKTTKGIEFLIQWKDGSTAWVTLKDMKNSYPVQMAEYVVHHRI